MMSKYNRQIQLKMNRRYTVSARKQSLLSTMDKGFNIFEDIPFRATSLNRQRRRLKTDPNGQIQQMLEMKKRQCQEIRQQLKKERQVQLNDFIKKSLKYQELLDINDTKRKRLPTLNSKIGQVIRTNLKAISSKKKIYSLKTMFLPLHSSTIPTREGHTTIIFKQNAIVIGGHCSHPFPSGHIYSFSSNTWIKKFDLPSARSYHSTILYKDKYALIFGGMGQYDISRKSRVCYNSVNIIDIHSFNTRIMKMRGEELVSPRRSHACALMGKYMIIFGGLNMRREAYSDLVYLDLKELKWYQKEFIIESPSLNIDLESGIAHHKGLANFRKKHKNLPLYSSEYTDQQGIYFFGGSFGNGNQNTLLLLGLNTYNPCLKKVHYSGTPPSSSNTLVERIDQNMVLIISGQIDNRGVKMYKIKEKEFLGVYKFNNLPFLGGVGSTLNKYEDGYILMFGMNQNGYTSDVAMLQIEEKESEEVNEISQVRKESNFGWKQWDFSFQNSEA